VWVKKFDQNRNSLIKGWKKNQDKMEELGKGEGGVGGSTVIPVGLRYVFW